MTAGKYDPLLVALSIGIAIFASYTALALANRVSVSVGRARAAWLSGGSLAMGSGIWSMHFIGMLAFSMPGMAMAYDVPLLLLSILVAVLASALALYVVGRPEVTRVALSGGALAMGAAICGMHYIGIAGMRMPARVEWIESLVVASVVIAIGAAYAALWLAGRLRYRQNGAGLRVLAGVVMGVAISGMHYTAMAAMRFMPLEEPLTVNENDLIATGGLAIAVTISTLLILTIALVSSAAQRELERQTGVTQEHVVLFYEAERRATEQAALRSMTEELSSALTVEDVLRKITHSALEATGAGGAFVEAVDPEGERVTVNATSGALAPRLGLRAPYAGSFAERVGFADEPFLCGPEDSATLLARLGLEGDGVWVLAVPLVEETRAIGALVLLRGSLRPRFHADDAARALTFTHLASLAFRRARLLEETARRREQLERAERLAGLGRVASTIAHEFNNVLMAIQAFNEATRRVGTFEQYLRTAPQVDRAIQRGKSVTEAVLRLTRAAQPNLRAIDLHAWLQVFAGDLAALLPAEIRVEIESERELFVLADPSHLEQVFLNLALNARDAMGTGGQFSIRAARERGSPDSPLVHVEVADTGAGMSEETRKRIFEPLYTTRASGTGLGLSIVHEIVRAHGGWISAESEPGRGTVFHLRMRLASAPAEPQARSEECSTQVRRIVLVEDDDAVAEGIILVLELSCFEIRRVSLGREAVAAIAEFGPDAVVLDVGLPDMDGLGVYRLIQRESPDLPVVFATGHADEKLLAEIRDLPHVGFLRKPFASEVLISTIEKAVRGTKGSPGTHPGDVSPRW